MSWGWILGWAGPTVLAVLLVSRRKKPSPSCGLWVDFSCGSWLDQCMTTSPALPTSTQIHDLKGGDLIRVRGLMVEVLDCYRADGRNWKLVYAAPAGVETFTARVADGTSFDRFN